MAAITEDIARAYNDLVEINKTGAKGYQEAAEGVSNPQLKSELSRFSQQRAQFASDLEQHAQQYGISPQNESTVEGVVADAAAAVHRGWINIKSAITGQDDSAILGECETGDKVALEAYEKAMSTGLPAEAKNVIQKQHSEILAAKNQITTLKGQTH
ncbi:MULTISPECIES: PA2169 family four-helix-bundle protein [Hymenobacter]|uniref:PA2169 family four-helix-bundle protein n=1 Tax=Hymenobacter jejuensis TaxID=2502781 RepID=A0A5B8A3V3_9BACT|nr:MULTISPECIES: PA2169 family four-helix-bundle protein [Hymenobacter]MBC6990020.1 PA2169 family four-helix-bundle protein [Hymenobacter sp. BT491]QDA62051.1 PA2169 family four-helix-bundle protein [Hymenobacter jejuensis]